MKQLLLALLLSAAAPLYAADIGTFTLLGPTTDCPNPNNFVCNNFTVTNCLGIDPINGVIADSKPAGSILRVALFLSAGKGKLWWSDTDTGFVAPFFQSLRNAGTEIIQIKWNDIAWEQSHHGISSGEEAVGCRPATAIQWVHDHYPAAAAIFAVTGQSGGAAQLGYAMTSYGLADSVNIAVFTSGPPMAAIRAGCLHQGMYGYSIDNEQTIDLSYGYDSPNTDPGPCVLNDPSFTDTWNANSVETGGIDYLYPSTIVDFIIGGADPTSAPYHARSYFAVLSAQNQKNMQWQVVQSMKHDIVTSQEGLNLLAADLLQPTPTPPPR
jgi:hypothetical protein